MHDKYTLKQHGLTDSQFPSLLLLLMVTMKARLIALTCWELVKLQFTLMLVNGPYLRIKAFKLDEIKCIWCRTNRVVQIKCIFETKFVGNLCNHYVSWWSTFIGTPCTTNNNKDFCIHYLFFSTGKLFTLTDLTIKHRW